MIQPIIFIALLVTTGVTGLFARYHAATEEHTKVNLYTAAALLSLTLAFLTSITPV